MQTQRRKALTIAISWRDLLRDRHIKIQGPVTDWGYRVSITGIFLLAITLAVKPVFTFDVFYYLEAGRSFFANNYEFIAKDIYLFTLKDAPQFVSHEWGSILLTYIVYMIGGFNLLIALKCVLIAGTIAIPVALAHKLQSQSFLLPLALVGAVYAFSSRFFLRTDLITTMFLLGVLATVIYVRETAYRYQKRYLLLPVVFLAWVNLHPGFLLGLFVWGIAIIVDAFNYWRGENSAHKSDYAKFACLYAASFAMCFVNPNFIDGFLFPIDLALADSAKIFRIYIPEWQPAIAHFNLVHVKLFFLLLAICLAVIINSLRSSSGQRRESVLFEILMFGFFAYFGLSGIRYIGISSMAFTILLVTLIKKKPSVFGNEKSRTAARISYTFVLLVSLLISFFCIRGIYREVQKDGWQAFIESKTPHRLAAFIEENNIDTSRMYNHIRFGSYFVWRWGGEKKIFVHSFIRDADFFENDYIAAQLSEEEFDYVISKYDIQTIVLPPHILEKFPIGQILEMKKEWHLDYRDNFAVVYNCRW